MRITKIFVVILQFVFMLQAGLTIKNVNDGSGFILDKDGNLITSAQVEKTTNPAPVPGRSCLLFKHIGLGQNLVVIDSINVRINEGGLDDILLPDSGNIVFKWYNGSSWDWKAFGDHSIPTFRVAHSILTPDLDLLLPNHIHTFSYRYKGKKGKTEAIQYADGYGRVVQTQAILNNYKSLITGTYFNENNAKYKVALPFASSKFGQYLDMRDEKLIDSANKYYSEKYGYIENFAYAETKYHNDPQGKVAASSIPGGGFQLGAGHEVKSWEVGVFASNGYFSIDKLISGEFEQIIANRPDINNAKYMLYIVRDRDGNFVQHVKNSKDELVLAWSYDGTKEIISKYEYDDRGNLLHEIMPIEVAGKGRCRNSYGYDTQDRLIWKVSPDKDTVRFYYDKFSRLDSTVAPNNTLIPEYDELGRLVKSYVRINGGDKVLLARTYYDSKSTLDNEIFDVFEKPEDLAIFKKIIGLDGKGEIKYTRGRSIATVTFNSKDEVINGDAGFSYKGSPLVGLTSQDEEGRTNAIYSYYGAVGWQKAVSTFDLQGNVLTTDTYHHYDPSKENTSVISIENVYDDLGRVVAVRDNRTKEKFVSFVFAETGEVKEKLLYGKDNKVIDKVTFTNNIRGQLQELESDKYKQSLGYVGSYNGNITSTTHDYKNGTVVTQNFAYDGVNRLLHSTTPIGNAVHQDKLTESFVYDENGRFDTRTKDGQTWTYNYFDGRYGDNILGHQLKSVIGHHSDDVNNENYEYDENGNMVWDKSKNMHVTYNYQNMPVKLTFYEDTRDLNPETRLGDPISEVEMVYNGAGTRLQKIERIFNGNSTVTVNGKLYSGGFVYTATNTVAQGAADNLNFELDYVNTPGGRIDYENGVEQERFVYLQDHLGSTRMTLNEAGVVVESDLYTAFGEEVDMVTANETTEKFTGKELDKEGAVEGLSAGMGLNFFGWRYYDPVVGMWISRDPLEQYWSGYSYSFNPINTIDPDGLLDFKIVLQDDLQGLDISGHISAFNDKYKGVHTVGIVPLKDASLEGIHNYIKGTSGVIIPNFHSSNYSDGYRIDMNDNLLTLSQFLKVRSNSVVMPITCFSEGHKQDGVLIPDSRFFSKGEISNKFIIEALEFHLKDLVNMYNARNPIIEKPKTGIDVIISTPLIRKRHDPNW